MPRSVNTLNRMYVVSCISRRDISYLAERTRSLFCVCQETELIALHALKRLVQLVGDITICCSVNKKHSLLNYPILENLVSIIGDILVVVCIYRKSCPEIWNDRFGLQEIY